MQEALRAEEGAAVERQGLEAQRTEDGDGVWDGNVHDHEEGKDWTGNFVVLGTTGSGKTTLIRCAQREPIRTVFTALCV